jgi:deazaflavin-dependent oxidoreductase (nitroreductase family)
VDITTIGRKSGQPRRIEIWYHRVDGRYYLSGLPGRRDWVANLEANPRFTFHLKRSAHASLPALAVPVTDAAERRRIFARIVSNPRYYERWVAGSPLVEVAFPDAE